MLNSETSIRIAAFLLVFLAMAAFELWSPRLERAELIGALKRKRWFTNLSIVIISSLCLRMVFPAAAVGAALVAQEKGWGLLPWVGIHPLLAGLIAFVALDFAVWLEHVASHKIPILWRVHKMHHSDTGFDVTTALRFHPLEILISMAWKIAIVFALGPPALSVLLFEISLNATSMFNHSNFDLSRKFDRTLRRMLVTPDMHRVHHSTMRVETDSNYGFNLPIWDRIFGTYRPQPSLGHDGMEIGLSEYRGERPAGLLWSLRLPFTRAVRRS